MIRKVFYIFFISIVFSSCGSRSILFELSARMDFRIGLGLSVLETHSFVKKNIVIPINLTASNNAVINDDIDQVVAQTAFLRPRFGDDINLDFINAVQISIIDSETLRSREIFFIDFVRFGSKTEIELMPSLTDIKDLVKNDRAIVEASIKLRQFPPQTFEMDLVMNFAGFAEE